MKKLWNKILDLFHIEHHERGTLRIVKTENGHYHVQEWQDDDYYGGNWSWSSVKNGEFSDLVSAQHLYDSIIKQRDHIKKGKQIIEVCIQQEG